MSIDEQITDYTNKKGKVDDIHAQAQDLASKIEPVVSTFQETGNFLYGVRVANSPLDDEYLINTASVLNSYKEGLVTLTNDCIVESNKLGQKIKNLEDEKKRQEEEARAAEEAAEEAAKNRRRSSTNNTNKSKRATLYREFN